MTPQDRPVRGDVSGGSEALLARDVELSDCSVAAVIVFSPASRRPCQQLLQTTRVIVSSSGGLAVSLGTDDAAVKQINLGGRAWRSAN